MIRSKFVQPEGVNETMSAAYEERKLKDGFYDACCKFKQHQEGGWEVEDSRLSRQSQAAGRLKVFTPGRRCRCTAAGTTSGWWSTERFITSASGPKGIQEGFGSSATMLERMQR
ncbi:hypothetical protein XENOCAPTIV_002161 [Xenoophorus captivus]|uniref:Uncharacterized protein n=1 Tax=Xenoophorus captivus TaxID=1517983 RepID=A0ABV0QXZ6_9TELE